MKMTDITKYINGSIVSLDPCRERAHSILFYKYFNHEHRTANIRK